MGSDPAFPLLFHNDPASRTTVIHRDAFLSRIPFVFFVNTTSCAKILANPGFWVAVKSRIPSRNFAFSRISRYIYVNSHGFIYKHFLQKVDVSKRLLARPPTIGLLWATTSRKRPLTLRILCGRVREVRLYQRERMVLYRGCNPWPFFLIHRLFKHYRCGKTPGTCISSEKLWRRCFNRTVTRWCLCLLFLEESMLISLFSLSHGNLTEIRLLTKLSGVFSFVLVYHPLLN